MRRTNRTQIEVWLDGVDSESLSSSDALMKSLPAPVIVRSYSGEAHVQWKVCDDVPGALMRVMAALQSLSVDLSFRVTSIDASEIIENGDVE